MLALWTEDLNAKIARDVEAAGRVNTQSVLSAFGLNKRSAVRDAAIGLDIVSKDARLPVGYIESLLIRAQHDAVGTLNVLRNAGQFAGSGFVIGRRSGTMDAV